MGGRLYIYIFFLVVTVIVGSVENCVFLHGFWGKKSILIILSEKENKQQVWGVKKWWKIAALRPAKSLGFMLNSM